MKINRLEIQNIRGIRHLTLSPEGKSIVVYGPNGSGKSAIVDAIDFLLTGDITRLRGQGTRGITPARYGPHIDTDVPQDAWVSATFELPSGVLVDIKRDFDNPRVYLCDEEHRGELDSLMKASAHGQYILNRREILKYITAERGARGRAIQTLLKMDDVESVRRQLVQIFNTANQEYGNAEEQLRTDQGRVAEAASLSEYNTDSLIRSVNSWRQLLGAREISELTPEVIRQEISPPQEQSQALPNKTLVREKILNLQDLLGDETLQSHQDAWSSLMSSVGKFRDSPELMRDYHSIDLIKKGIVLLGESPSCPLCGHEWPIGELRSSLESRLSGATEAKTFYDQAKSSAKSLRDAAKLFIDRLRAVGSIYQQIGLESESGLMEQSAQAVEDDLGCYDVDSLLCISGPQQSNLVNVVVAIRKSEAIASGLQWVESTEIEPSPMQTAWDRLVGLETQLRDLESTKRNFEERENARQRATVLWSSYVHARDSIVELLFQNIRNRFVSLYSRIHSEDEPAFSATLELDGPECEFLVDFHGRDQHPPHALHSEGHQDSMGFCIYLAIAEHLGRDHIELIVLDDVVMSIDADHRRGVCDILRDDFPEHQFLITTHDKTWAYQLKEGLSIDRNCFIQFSNWTIELGPSVEEETNIWESVYNLIVSKNIPGASHMLRRWLEQFFDKVCANVLAKTTHTQDGRHDLWDMLSGAISRHKELIKEGMRVARVSRSNEELERLGVLESVRLQILQRMHSEYWAVNAAVHYNEWANFTHSDFRPVVEAFEDFCAQFICQSCGTLIRVLKSGFADVAVRCNCGASGWSLVV